MKKAFLAICCVSLLWSACKENNTPIDFGGNSLIDTTLIDTSYIITTVPAADPHQVLIEEFTGQSCSNCPFAHSYLDGIATAPGNEGLVNTIGLYIKNFSQTTPPGGAVYDFRTDVATTISHDVYGSVGALPTAGVDRTKVAGQVLLNTGDWASTITNRLAATNTDSLNLKVTSSYDSTTHKATIIATVTYLYNVVNPNNLSIAIVEDGMTDKQEFPDSVHSGYVFTNVFREMVTASNGDVLGTTPVKVQGQVYMKGYSYTPKAVTPAIVPANCRVIAFVSNETTGDRHIIQSAHCKLK